MPVRRLGDIYPVMGQTWSDVYQGMHWYASGTTGTNYRSAGGKGRGGEGEGVWVRGL